MLLFLFPVFLHFLAHHSSTLLYHINIAWCQWVEQGDTLFCAPTGKVFRAAVLAEGPGCCILSCLGSPLLRQALHLLSKKWDLQKPVTQQIPKRADGESPGEEQSFTVPELCLYRCSLQCKWRILWCSGITVLNQPFFWSYYVQRRLSRQASKCFLCSDITGGLGNIYVFTTLQWK